MVMASTLSPAPHAELLQRVFSFSGSGFTKPLAEGILAMDLPSADADRAAELNEKANEGLLTAVEREELQAYANVSDLLAYWQLKAAQVLAQDR